ncbi:MAG: hypothetical protein JNL40_12360 [Cyclobacteriaceae bacterium]|nr:hypothetical protein [Cyclobacteriaceae bacterium]
MKLILPLIILLSFRSFGQIPEGNAHDSLFLAVIDRFIDSTRSHGYPDKGVIKVSISDLVEVDSERVVNAAAGRVRVGGTKLSYKVKISLVRNSDAFRIDFPSACFNHRKRRVYVFLGSGNFFYLTDESRKKLIRDVKRYIGSEALGNSEVASMGFVVDGHRIYSTKLIR